MLRCRLLTSAQPLRSSAHVQQWRAFYCKRLRQVTTAMDLTREARVHADRYLPRAFKLLWAAPALIFGK